MIDQHVQQVLDFWFVESTPEQWFKKDPQFDQQIKNRFGEIFKRAAVGECFTWRETIEGRLAEIIVLDQFSRNIWRDDARAFSQDNSALILAQEAIKQLDYLRLQSEQRKFIIMPFMHSESAYIHQQAIPLFKALNDEFTFDYELKHKAIIDRFGRYPHRNEILGRKSSEQEIAFLQQPGSGF